MKMICWQSITLTNKSQNLPHNTELIAHFDPHFLLHPTRRYATEHTIVIYSKGSWASVELDWLAVQAAVPRPVATAWAAAPAVVLETSCWMWCAWVSIDRPHRAPTCLTLSLSLSCHPIRQLFSGSVQTQQGDEAANSVGGGASSSSSTDDADGSSDSTRTADGYTEGIPGPVTRLVVLANRGLANLVQDLILVRDQYTIHIYLA